MDSFLSLPISVWANEIAFFLEIHDLFSLRLTSKYCNRHTVRILHLYGSILSQQRESLSTTPDYVETTFQVRMAIIDGTYILSSIEKHELLDLKCYKMPPDCGSEESEVLAFLLTGKKSKDPWGDVFRGDFAVHISKLRDMEEVPQTDMLDKFLQKYTELDRVKLMRGGGGKVYKYFEAVARAKALQNEEYMRKFRRIKKIDGEMKIVVKFLTKIEAKTPNK